MTVLPSWSPLALSPALALALTACDRQAPAPVTRPDWQGATVDGIAPLMSPPAVAIALRQRGYRQVRCGNDRPVDPRALARGSEPGCFEAVDRPMRVSLFFLDLKQGRRLAVVNFSDRMLHDDLDRVGIERGRALARRLRVHLGRPLTSSRGSAFVTLYWGRPGGSPSLPDLVSTTIGANFGANVTMTSFWAYGQQVPTSDAKGI